MTPQGPGVTGPWHTSDLEVPPPPSPELWGSRQPGLPSVLSLLLTGKAPRGRTCGHRAGLWPCGFPGLCLPSSYLPVQPQPWPGPHLKSSPLDLKPSTYHNSATRHPHSHSTTTHAPCQPQSVCHSCAVSPSCAPHIWHGRHPLCNM